MNFRRLLAEVVFLLRMQASARRHARHLRRHGGCTDTARAARHVEAMRAEVKLRQDLCARRGGRPGPSASRSSSGVPLVPRPSHQVTNSSSGGTAAVPGCGSVSLSPEGQKSEAVAARA